MEIARKAALVGGQVIAKYFQEEVVLHEKQETSYNLVSKADIEAEHAIVDFIREHRPDHAVLAEEKHQDASDSQHLWIIDPLDGTTNFAHHIPHFAVSVAYYENSQPRCGVIYNPIREDWFEAIRGQGARHNDQPVHCGSQTRLEEVLIGVGFYYDRGAMMEATLDALRDLFHKHVRGIRRMGTASLDLVQVGMGLFGAYFEYELSPWDFAAGRLFVEEAGGRVTTCHGQPLPLAKTNILASNGHLHETMVEMVGKHFSR